MASACLPGPVCDWRDAEAYAWLLHAGRAAFAWEWLRRDGGYRSGWRDDFAAFGLLAPVDPDGDARWARPCWSSAVDPAVLQCMVGGAG
ncbi:MAG: hypothetical protein DI569_16740, partial [Sphingopyxis macrogoltabida]